MVLANGGRTVSKKKIAVKRKSENREKTEPTSPLTRLPREGDVAPAFSAPAAGGQTVSLSDYVGKKVVVLYFYPKDNTSGCTKEACGFRDDWAAARRAGIEVIGVSPDSATSHEKFAAKYELPFTLVADEDHKIAEAYGVWQEKSMYGRKYFGIARTTFVIDKKGGIAKVFEKVKPVGHSAEVLSWVRDALRL
jgi:peroxiredoxin Q/BCP